MKFNVARITPATVLNTYDFTGRLSFNQFGLSGLKRVYEQEVEYNAFSEISRRETTYWDALTEVTAGFVNGRKTAPPGGTAPSYGTGGG